MVKKAKPKKRLSTSDSKREPLTRVDWGFRALRKRRDAIDYGKRAKTRHADTTENYTAWVEGGHKKYDLEGHDYPRPDVKKIPKTYHKYAGAPKARVSKTAKMAEKVLRKNFTAKERKDIGKVFIEGSRPQSKKAAGTNAYYPSDEVSIVKIDPSYADDEDVYTHELVHSRRHGSKDSVKDRNREEKQTEFETVGRLSSPDKKTAGYYYHIKGGDVKDDIKHDRILLTGSMAKKRKGKRFVEDVEKKYDKSKIKTAHFSPAENLDRYFQVILPHRKRVEIHRRYKPHAKDTKAQILKQFKEQFGKDITAYEWENGKRVRIGGTVKRRKAISKTKRSPIKRKISSKQNLPVKRKSRTKRRK